MPSEIEIQELEEAASNQSSELESSDTSTIEYSTTNIIVQAANIAEATFAISGSAYTSENMPAQNPMGTGY